MIKNLMTKAYVYRKFGAPRNVLNLEEITLTAKPNFSVIEAPINPSDINAIEGKYPVISKEDPMVAGNECVGFLHKNGKRLLALPKESGSGTWRERMHIDPDNVLILPEYFEPIPNLSMISVNPSTAFRLLKDFKTLKKGDTVIQNCANSMVGRSVIQLARHYGIHTVNLVRERKPMESIVNELKSLGADYVCTESQLLANSKEMFETIPKPDLALDAVGHTSVYSMSKLLNKNGSVVTYGGMSKKPITISAGHLIFKNFSYHGFWITRWMKENSIKERIEMFEEIYELMRSEKLKFNTSRINFDNAEMVLDRIENPIKDTKTIISMGPN